LDIQVQVKRSRILIVGGLGYVGGRLARHIHLTGCPVILGSRRECSAPPWLPQAQTVKVCWGDESKLAAICAGVDVIVHAAGMNAEECAADPIAAHKFNGTATAHLVNAASSQGVRRLIYLSSAHVYSAPLTGTITEATRTKNPHPYATSHCAGEEAIFRARERGDIEGVVVRISNAFGAPAYKGANCWMLLVNDVCRQAVESNRIVLKSGGLQRRDFISMTEVCRALTFLACRDFKLDTPALLNIGTGQSRSVLEVVGLVQQRCGILLDLIPELTRPHATVSEIHPPLDYRIEALQRIGYKTDPDLTMEIDSLLLFCRNAFTRYSNT
jgi:UDP-glucose 4-epimerase